MPYHTASVLLFTQAPGDHGGTLGAGAELVGADAVGNAGSHRFVHIGLQRRADGPLRKGRLDALHQLDELGVGHRIDQLINVHVFLLSAGDRRVKQCLFGLAAACEARQGLAVRFIIQGHCGANLGQRAAFAEGFHAPGAAVEGEGDQGVPLVGIELVRQRAIGRVVHRVGKALAIRCQYGIRLGLGDGLAILDIRAVVAPADSPILLRRHGLVRLQSAALKVLDEGQPSCSDGLIPRPSSQ